MKSKDKIARVKETIDASIEEVWDGLVNPEKIKQYMFGTEVSTDWHEGSAIIWQGEWQGKTFEDKGIVLQNSHGVRLQYSHFSPLSGEEDKMENYHVVTIELEPRAGKTIVSLSQDNNPSDEAKQHSEKNWAMMLKGLKECVEKQHLASLSKSKTG